MTRIIVSAGHTNKDPGTVVSGIREVDLTRKIVKEVVSLLRAENIITLSVPPDLELAKRIAWINQTGYDESNKDIAIEIHINDGGKRGIEGWHQADKPDSQQLTNDIINSIIKNTGWVSQGNRSEYEHPLGSLAFIHNTNTIACIIECGYIDNAQDLEFLKDENNIKKIAQGVVNGIKNFLGLNKKNAIPTQQKPQKVVNDEPKQDNTTIDKKPQTEPAQIQTPGYTTPAPAPIQPFPSPQVMTSPQNFNTGIGGGVSDFGSGFSGGFGNTNTNFGNTNPAGYMTRDQRKDMIKKNYVKILGREPNQADLNYFLNTGINEEQLIKKMVDSQEHADLVKARQEVIQTKKEFVEQRNEILRLKAKVNDQRGILKNLNALLMQKNAAITSLQRKYGHTNVKQIKQIQPNMPQYSKTPQEKFLDYFSKKLG